MGRWPWWAWVLAAVVVVVGAMVAIAALAGDDDGDGDGDTSEPTVTSTSTTATTSTSSTSTTVPASTTAPGTDTTAPAPGPVPGAAADVTARPGAGSAEVVVRWGPAADATGYMVLRQEAGGFRVMADVDITTGETVAGDEVVNLWSAEHTYIPAGDPLDGPDGSPWFEYVEVGGQDERCFRVVSYSPAGAGPPSETVCSFPP